MGMKTKHLSLAETVSKRSYPAIYLIVFLAVADEDVVSVSKYERWH